MRLEVHEHEGARGQQRCPFCHDALGELPTWTCAACGTVHHVECVWEHGRCAELGCTGRPAPVVAPRRRLAWLLVPSSFMGFFVRTMLVFAVTWLPAFQLREAVISLPLFFLPFVYVVAMDLVLRSRRSWRGR